MDKNFEKQFSNFYQNVIIVLDSNAKLKILERKSDVMTSVIWIYFTDSNYNENLRNLYIPYNSRFFIINKVNEFDYEIKNVYQISEKSSKIYSNFANMKNGEIEFFVKDIYSQRMDLNGHQFNVALSSVSQS